jgi:hypothetical protein
LPCNPLNIDNWITGYFFEETTQLKEKIQTVKTAKNQPPQTRLPLK